METARVFLNIAACGLLGLIRVSISVIYIIPE